MRSATLRGTRRSAESAPHPVTVEALESRCLLSAQLPAGFQYTNVASVPNMSTSMVFAPGGRIYFTEKAGAVRVVENGVTLATPVLSLKVDTLAERGLECIELDPNFQTNGFFYLYYTRPDPAKPNQPNNAAKNRVSRFRIDPTNPDRVDPNTPERVLVDNIPTVSGYHNAGALHFGPDGMLYVTTGEAGQLPSQSFSQNLGSLGGKVLRINPAAYPNLIPATNPFVNTPGARGEVWAYGLRNPFTSAINPLNGTMYVNDVGDAKWEEIDEIKPGKNYGWPLAEGASTNPSFTNPIYAYPHSDSVNGSSAAITGGTFYVASQFPAAYQGKYFFSDFVNQRVRVYDPATGKATPFASGLNGAFDLDVGPDGSLYGLGPYGKAIWRIKYVGGGGVNRAPFAAASADKTSGLNPLTVTFSGAGSSDPDGDPLAYAWKFGDGTTGSGVTVSHTYTAAGDFTVGLTVSDGRGGSTAAQPIVIHSGNRAPSPVISLPANNAPYTAGQTISFVGSATDPEDGALPASAFHWSIVLHHQTHTHPFEDFDDITSGSFQIPTVYETDPVQWFRVHLVVTDSKGLSAETTVDVRPTLGDFTLASNVSGIKLTLDGLAATLGHKITGVVGAQRQLGAAATQVVNGVTYQFTGWSDGGAATHVIATPPSATTYTANYKPVSGSTRTLTPLADAYVRGGPSAALNFGSVNALIVKKDATLANTRESYLKFDISSLNATSINGVRLRLFGSITDTAGRNLPVGVYSVASTTWSESTVVWNTRPPTSASPL